VHLFLASRSSSRWLASPSWAVRAMRCSLVMVAMAAPAPAMVVARALRTAAPRLTPVAATAVVTTACSTTSVIAAAAVALRTAARRPAVPRLNAPRLLRAAALRLPPRAVPLRRARLLRLRRPPRWLPPRPRRRPKASQATSTDGFQPCGNRAADVKKASKPDFRNCGSPAFFMRAEKSTRLLRASALPVRRRRHRTLPD
jgi:hypothetical protein